MSDKAAILHYGSPEGQVEKRDTSPLLTHTLFTQLHVFYFLQVNEDQYTADQSVCSLTAADGVCVCLLGLKTNKQEFYRLDQ